MSSYLRLSPHPKHLTPPPPMKEAVVGWEWATPTGEGRQIKRWACEFLG